MERILSNESQSMDEEASLRPRVCVNISDSDS